MIRYVYDPQTFRLARLRSEPAPANPPRTSPPPAIQDYGYSYDLVGNLLALHDRTPGSGISPTPDQLDRAFSYDPLYRLTSATGRECDIPPPAPWLDTPRCIDLTKVRAYAETYTYDDVGGLLTLAHQAGTGGFARTFDITPDTNQAAAMTSGSATYRYAYDASGNMLSEMTNRIFEWNHANQLATFRNQTPQAEPTLYVEYRYDTTGQRVLRIVRKHGEQLAVTTYIGGLFERITLTDSTNTSSYDTLHILDGATRVAIKHLGPSLPDDTSPEIAYHLGDHLGSSTVVLDGSGDLFNREEYTPYGETSFGSYAKKRYRHTAKERDEESGLYYRGARYYASWIGRWINTDPVGLSDGVNLYCYVHDNPVTHTDPTGQTDEAQGTSPPQPQITGASSAAAGAESSPSQQVVSANSQAANLPAAQEPSKLKEYLALLGGILFGTAQSLTPLGFLMKSPAPESRPFEFGRGAGQIATGLAEVVGGAGVATAGAGIDVAGGAGAPFTGGASLVLELPGTGAILAGLGIAIYGSINVGAGGITLSHAMAMSSSGSGGGRAPTAPTGGSSPTGNNRRYEASPKHGMTKRGEVGAAPSNGQAALDRSVQVKPTSSRRVGVDAANNEIVVFDETHPGQEIYHGHVRSWDELTSEMQNALRTAKLVDPHGKIIL